MHSRKHREEQAQTLQQCAAAIAFPAWEPEPDDWTHLYTSFTPDGKPITEVAVYRVRERIHYATYSGDDLMQFWTRLLNEVSERHEA